MAQTFTDWEAICVDDGSTDGSGAILDEYAAKDNRFRVIHQKNAGVSAARNIALDVAQGEWICFLDADDMVGIDWLKDVEKTSRCHPESDWIRTRYRDWYGSSRETRWSEGHVNCEKVGFLSDGNLVHEAWERFSILGLIVLNFFRKTVVAQHRFIEGLVWLEDILFCVSVAGSVKSCVVIANDSYRYRIHESSAAHRAWSFAMFFPVLWNLREIWCKHPGNEASGTFLIVKNFMRLLRNGGMYTWKDGFGLSREILHLHAVGAFSCRCIANWKDRVRWRLYLWTGMLGFLHWPLSLRLIIKGILKGERLNGKQR